MYEALMFLLIWYSVSTTLFQIILSKIFISDCVAFFDTIATFIQSIAGWIILTGKNMAQISNGISNPVVAGIVYWLIRILICGGCLVGAGILLAFTGIKIAGLYKKYCWDMITILVTLISMAIAIYFGDWIKTVLPINLLFFLLFVQLVYVCLLYTSILQIHPVSEQSSCKQFLTCLAVPNFHPVLSLSLIHILSYHLASIL